MKTKLFQRLGSSLLVLVMLLALLPVTALAAKPDVTTDFVYSYDKNTVSSAGGTVTLTVDLPTNVPVSAYAIGLILDEAVDAGATWDMTCPEADTQWSKMQCEGKTNWPMITGDTGYAPITTFLKGCAAKLTLTFPAGIKASDFPVNIYCHKSANIGYLDDTDSYTYFDVTNSRYKNGDVVVFTVNYSDSGATVTPGSGSNSGSGTGTGNGSATTHKCAAFTDIASHWAKDGICYCVENGLMNGVSDTSFQPNGQMTRAMLVTVLYRMAGSPKVTGSSSFTDVSAGQWYTDAVIWASANGIVTGYSNGLFGTNDNVTREQIAAILYRYATFKKMDVSVGEDTNILSYDDATDISSYAISAIQWACGAGLMSGRTNSTLVPTGTATRAEVATILSRFNGK